MLTRFVMTIWRASTDAYAYAEDFAKRRTGSGLGYLYWLSTTLAFFGLLPFAIALAVLAPQARTFADRQLAIVQDWYPDELVLTISGGMLTTNANEPYVLDLPAEWSDGDEGERMRAIVIDTSASIDDFHEYETAVLLTGKAAAVRDDNGLRVFLYDDLERDVMINEALVRTITDHAREYTHALPALAWLFVLALLFVFPWIVGAFAWLGTLFFLAWSTLLLWIFTSVAGRGFAYGELFRLGLFGVTNSVLAAFILQMIGISFGWIPYVLFFCWMGYVLTRFPRRHAPFYSGPPAAGADHEESPGEEGRPEKTARLTPERRSTKYATPFLPSVNFRLQPDLGALTLAYGRIRARMDP